MPLQHLHKNSAVLKIKDFFLLLLLNKTEVRCAVERRGKVYGGLKRGAEAKNDYKTEKVSRYKRRHSLCIKEISQ